MRAAVVIRHPTAANIGWLVCLRGSGEIAGVINVSEIVRGSFRSAYLGYYVFEANIQPGNRASLALVKSCGFVKEGYSRRYLKIGGRWRDHERWAIVAA